MIYTRRTIAEPVTFEGLGLHTGDPVKVRVHPGESGILFQVGSEHLPATPENVTDTTRSTRVGPVGTVEHLMSALAGLEITDVTIEVEGGEIPGMDGSSKPFVDALLAGGFADLGPAELPPLFTRLFLQEDGVKVAVGKGSGEWRFMYDVSPRWPGIQAYETHDVITDYASDIAPARTFALAEEVPQIIQLGLGRGLDEHSAVIVGIEGYKNEARYPDELARHKLLDVIGDLYLSGVPARFLNVVAEKSGHRTNVKMAAMLREAVKR